ncbi:MAG: OmpA family protein [Phycisphaerales bacterium]|nr:OmpA family protein [Phycisphaerales bacterium]
MTRIGVDGVGAIRPIIKGLAGAVVAVVLCLGTGGCADNSAQTTALLEAENQEYLDANERLKYELAAAVDQRDQAVRRAQAVVDENNKLRTELDEQRARPRTGFEGIKGVSGTTRPGEVVAEVAGDVLFASGSATLRSAAKRTLDRIAHVLNTTYAGHNIRIEGHTDTDPISKSAWKTNDRLSAERAMAVKAYLATKGVDGARIYIGGFGDTRTRATKEASRRVEIVVLAK